MLKKPHIEINIENEFGYGNKDPFLFLLEEYNRYLSRHLSPPLKSKPRFK